MRHRPAFRPTRLRSTRPALLAAVAVTLLGCAASAPVAASPQASPQTSSGTAPARATSAAAPTTTLPPANGRFDYQIGGAYPPAAGMQIVDRDRHDPPAAGAYGICYVNAFQTQPEDRAWWTAHHPDLLLRDAAGKLVVDSAWNEVLLDLRTPAKRSALAGVVGPWTAGCASAGYRGAELDNLDSWTRSKGLMTYAQARAYATLLVRAGHAAGLAVGQKNAVDRSADLHATAGFDFAIVEECQVYAECGSATAVYGAQVYEVEYPDNGGQANYQEACAARGARISVIYRDRDVVPRGSAGYVYRSC